MPLTAHFLNVGEGDSTIIEFPSGHIGWFDISNVRTIDLESAKELVLAEALAEGITKAAQLTEEFIGKALAEAPPTTDALDYFDSEIGTGSTIFRLVVSHPHMDHISGIHRLVTQEPNPILNLWHVGFDDFDLDESDWGAWKYSKADWDTYKALRQSSDGPKALMMRQGTLGHYWAPEDDNIVIWAPTDDLVAMAVSKKQQNILSMVLKVSYAGRSIVLGGDATANESWPAIYPEIDMTGIDVLKASHHGRNSGYYQPAVKEMDPWLTITSVGNPDHDATRKYRQYSSYTASLRNFGNIKITIKDDGTLVYPAGLDQVWKARLT